MRERERKRKKRTMTNREIVNTIRSHFESPISSTHKLTTRWVLFVLEKIRAALLYDSIKRDPVINDRNKQTISIPFIETDENFCDCKDNKSKCKILRSSCPIPKLLDNKIFDISSTNGKLQYELITPQELKYKQFSRIEANRNKIYVFTRTLSDGQYIYLANSEFVEKAILVGLFEEPQKVNEFNCCENTLPSCNPLDDEFILSDRLTPVLIETALKHFSTALGKGDIFNNDLSDLDSLQIRK